MLKPIVQKRVNRSLIVPIAAVIVLAAVFCLNSAKAQTLYEGFSYAPGTAVIATEGTGGTGWGTGTNWNSKSDTLQTQVAASSLSYTDGNGSFLNTSGGSLISQTPNGTTAQPQRQSFNTLGAMAAANTDVAGTLWMSYLWQGLNTTGSGLGIYRQSIMQFIVGATSGVGTGSERLDIGMPNISATHTINPNISLWTVGGITGGNGTLSSTAPLQSGVAANDGLTDFILVQFVADNNTTTADTVNVWINPILGGTLGSANLTWANQDMSGINGIRIANNGTNAADGFGGEQVDEISIGNTALSVENFTSAPEPSTLALAGLGGMAMLTLLRRRK